VNLEHQVREGPQEHLEGVAHLELVALVERLVYKESYQSRHFLRKAFGPATTQKWLISIGT